MSHSNSHLTNTNPGFTNGEVPTNASTVAGLAINQTYSAPVIPAFAPETVSIPIRGGFTESTNVYIKRCRPVYLLEKHMTVIKKGPTAPPTVQMFKWSDDIQEGSVYDDASINIETSFDGSDFPLNTADDGTTISQFFKSNKERKIVGDDVVLPINWQTQQMDWVVNQKLVIETLYSDHFGNQKSGTCRAKITALPGGVVVKILAISKNFPINAVTANDIYTVRAELIPPLFEMKFPQFAYRYKYEDGEYSVFGPWSEIAFMPGTFDYAPKKGYNLGMVNNMRSLRLRDWRPRNMPEDVVSIDLLYKEASSPNVYTVETFEKDPNDPSTSNTLPSYQNWWQGDAALPGTGSNYGSYKITSELIHKVLPSNQMLRPWDNVPRYALAQEMTANRLIFANYIQNYDLRSKEGGLIQPNFSVSIDENNYSIDTSTVIPNVKEPMKSLKSMRTYQVGVVYMDRYGRETPVLTNKSGAIDIPKSNAKLQNRLAVEMTGDAPDWAESYTFYIKETSNEYYNLAMDRWYNAEDDGVWISFPSSERNKLTDRSVIMLKKQHNTDRYVDSDIKYKILDIKNDAPTFIKTEYKFWGSLPMMLPPPGWGTGNKAGTWDTGMFHITGLPLPMRLYIDVYAEYFDQSVLAGLITQDDNARVQVRVTQSMNVSSAYASAPSQNINKSQWYDVSTIGYIGAPAETHLKTITDGSGNQIEIEEEIPGQQEQIVRITLEQLIGDDMSFCIPNDALSLSRGLSLEARTRVVRDKSEFQGRFFAKILRDEDLQANIIEPGQTSLDDAYQVLMSRRLKYIQFGSPGVQDYLTGAAGTFGAGKGKFYGNFNHEGIETIYNYVPIGKHWYAHTNLPHTGNFGIKYEYSSFTKHHWPAYYRTGAPLLGLLGLGVEAMPPSGSGEYFPWGPSYASNHMFMSGEYFEQYYDYRSYSSSVDYASHLLFNPIGSAGYPNANSGVPNSFYYGVIPNSSPTYNFWPSHIIPNWEPYSCTNCGSIDLRNSTTGSFAGGIDLSNASIAGLIPDFNDLQGANQFVLGAIWGDQSDLLGYTGNPANGIGTTPINYNVSTTNPVFDPSSALPAANIYPNPGGEGNKSIWTKDTITKLNEDWYYLFHGRDKVDGEWPLGKWSPERWFIDKVSSAQGGCGNGIWNGDVDGNGTDDVSFMDISFYGIGLNNSTCHRSHEMLTHQENEVDFAVLMATTGTQFRFSSDPNQTVYTIIKAEINEEPIYNYECPQGTWGSVDDSGVVSGGSRMGAGHAPPWGSPSESTGGIAGKTAFISDLFNVGNLNTGGAMHNYRTRITITLDKLIGSEGVAYGSANTGFHPLRNHVDADGNCNIEDGPKRYGSSTFGIGTKVFPEAMGGTPGIGGEVKRYYNLSSYWNVASGSTTLVNSDQSPLKNDTAYAAGQHFGLHERGLNSTTIEIITPYRGDDGAKEMSKNPAVWETEPMEDVNLDIYFAASPSYPTNIKRFRLDEKRPDPTDVVDGVATNAHYFDYNYRGEEIIPVGSQVVVVGGGAVANVTAVQGNRIWISQSISGASPLASGDTVRFYWNGEGFWYGNKKDDQYIVVEVEQGMTLLDFTINPESHKYKRSLSYFNCYTFSNGVESNRIRDDYNAIQIPKGIKASMPLAQGYKQERKASGLIFSGIYNSTSGINETNQFIQAEPITKDLNPVNGSIQKLFTRDTDLLTFCENKVFKILANKDALFNADGNTNLTSNRAVLGTATPFTGEYGISKNPESFASESYRVYFADKARGAVLRLSQDGLTPISSAGMKDWFKDNLYNASKIIGSFDDREGHYNLTVETKEQKTGNEIAYTLSFNEKARGWESFKSFIHEQGLSYKNVYYTFPSNNYSRRIDVDPWGVPYSVGTSANAEVYQHHMDLRIKRTVVSNNVAGTPACIVSGGTTPILPGMNVSGNGINTGTIVKSVIAYFADFTIFFMDEQGDDKKVYVDQNDEIEFFSARNNFYDTQHYSQLTTLFNDQPGVVKRFKTLNYEGTQSQVVPKNSFSNIANSYFIYDDNNNPTNTGIKWSDNYKKTGWFVENIITDMQKGSVPEFVAKENKWFNYIMGEIGAVGNLLDTSDFSLQGLGQASNVEVV